MENMAPNYWFTFQNYSINKLLCFSKNYLCLSDNWICQVFKEILQQNNSFKYGIMYKKRNTKQE